MTLSFGRRGVNVPRSQIQDYMFRGVELEGLPLIFFVSETYEELIPRDRPRRSRGTRDGDGAEEDRREDEEPTDGGDDDDGAENDDGEDGHANDDADEPGQDVVEANGNKRRRGRKPNQRSNYLETHARCLTHRRVVRTPGHNTIPKAVGQYYPPHDDPDMVDFFYASMLTLCKPWRKLEELKEAGQTWEDAYNGFLSTAPKRISHIISGIKYYYECRKSAAAKRDDNGLQHDERQRRRRRDEYEEIAEVDLEEEEDADEQDENGDAYQEELERRWDELCNNGEVAHGRVAVEIGRMCGFFKDEAAEWESTGPRATVATGDDMVNLVRWQNTLSESTSIQNPGRPQEVDYGEGRVTVDGGAGPCVDYVPDDGPREGGSGATEVDTGMLYEEQKRAYDIVDWHLQRTIQDRKPDQLLMHIPGEGGVGKSKVIQLITENFEKRGVGHKLVKAAFTGIAASLIGGKTLHVITKMGVGRKRNQGAEAAKQLSEYWSNKTHLIIDEISMVSCKMLARIERIISKARAGAADFNSTKSFGGLNVIILGDLHQFPPIPGGARTALFVPVQRTDIGKTGKEERKNSLNYNRHI